jgi:hypothetical protein
MIKIKDKTGFLGYIGVGIFTFYMLVIVLAFFNVLFTEGWTAAVTKVKVGPLIIGVLLFFGYVFAIVKNFDNGNKQLAKLMSYGAGIALLLFLFGDLHSCSINDTPEPTEIYFRN